MHQPAERSFGRTEQIHVLGNSSKWFLSNLILLLISLALTWPNFWLQWIREVYPVLEQKHSILLIKDKVGFKKKLDIGESVKSLFQFYNIGLLSGMIWMKKKSCSTLYFIYTCKIHYLIKILLTFHPMFLLSFLKGMMRGLVGFMLCQCLIGNLRLKSVFFKAIIWF